MAHGQADYWDRPEVTRVQERFNYESLSESSSDSSFDSSSDDEDTNSTNENGRFTWAMEDARQRPGRFMNLDFLQYEYYYLRKPALALLQRALEFAKSEDDKKRELEDLLWRRFSTKRDDDVSGSAKSSEGQFTPLSYTHWFTHVESKTDILTIRRRRRSRQGRRYGLGRRS